MSTIYSILVILYIVSLFDIIECLRVIKQYIKNFDKNIIEDLNK